MSCVPGLVVGTRHVSLPDDVHSPPTPVTSTTAVFPCRQQDMPSVSSRHCFALTKESAAEAICFMVCRPSVVR